MLAAQTPTPILAGSSKKQYCRQFLRPENIKLCKLVIYLKIVINNTFR